MKSFEQKREGLAKLRDKLGKSKLTVFTSFSRAGQIGLNVIQMRELKKNLKGIDSEYVVVKKTIFDRALHSIFRDFGKARPNVFAYEGSLGIVFGYGDEVASAKSIYNFAKKNPALKFFGALFDKNFMDANRFTELAKLPSRDILIGRVVGTIRYPLSGLVNGLQGNIRNLVGVLNQIGKGK